MSAKELNKELEKINPKWIILVETSADNVSEVGASAMKSFMKEGFTGIVLSASRPCKNLFSIYEDKGIETEKLFILDTVCKSQSKKTPEFDNVIHLNNAASLTDISISFTEIMKNIKGDKFFFLDSINTMLIHNDAKVFTKFIHSIMTRMRMNDVGGILMSIENNTDKDVRAEIAQLCDKILKV